MAGSSRVGGTGGGDGPTNRSRVNRSGPAGSVRRERELARQRRERQQARRIAARERARRRQTMLGAALAVLLVLGAVTFAFLHGRGTGSPSAAGKPSTAPGTATPSATGAAAAGPCRYPADGTAARKVGSPPAKPVATGSSTATLTTNRGVVRISLLRAQAPSTRCAISRRRNTSTTPPATASPPATA